MAHVSEYSYFEFATDTGSSRIPSEKKLIWPSTFCVPDFEFACRRTTDMKFEAIPFRPLKVVYSSFIVSIFPKLN